MSPEAVAVLVGCGGAALISFMGGAIGFMWGYERRDKRAEVTENALMDALDEARRDRDGAVRSLRALQECPPVEPPAKSETSAT